MASVKSLTKKLRKVEKKETKLEKQYKRCSALADKLKKQLDTAKLKAYQKKHPKK